MKYYSFLLPLLGNLLTTLGFAGTIGDIPQNHWRWVGALSAGPVWASGGKTQTISLTPEIIKTYTANKASSNSLIYGELFGGVQKNLTQIMQGQFGLAVATTSNASISGDIWDDAEPQFNNHIYSYKIQHNHLAVKGKLLVDKYTRLIPWLSGSIGVGFNYANSFQNIPTIFEAMADPNFASYTKTTFTYSVGVGLQTTLTLHWQAGIGYEFADWGSSRLDFAPGQTLNSGPSLNHFYTNGLLFNLTYLA